MELEGERRRSSEDRRKAPRRMHVAAVREAIGRRVYLTRDVSCQGIAVLRADDRVLPAETPLAIEFELPGGHMIRAVARVAHDAAGPRFRQTGFEFIRLERRERDYLDAFVRGIDRRSA